MANEFIVKEARFGRIAGGSIVGTIDGADSGTVVRLYSDLAINGRIVEVEVNPGNILATGSLYVFTSGAFPRQILAMNNVSGTNSQYIQPVMTRTSTANGTLWSGGNVFGDIHINAPIWIGGSAFGSGLSISGVVVRYV